MSATDAPALPLERDQFLVVDGDGRILDQGHPLVRFQSILELRVDAIEVVTDDGQQLSSPGGVTPSDPYDHAPIGRFRLDQRLAVLEGENDAAPPSLLLSAERVGAHNEPRQQSLR
jgi:hypothetical protein